MGGGKLKSIRKRLSFCIVLLSVSVFLCTPDYSKYYKGEGSITNIGKKPFFSGYIIKFPEFSFEENDTILEVSYAIQKLPKLKTKMFVELVFKKTNLQQLDFFNIEIQIVNENNIELFTINDRLSNWTFVKDDQLPGAHIDFSIDWKTKTTGSLILKKQVLRI